MLLWDSSKGYEILKKCPTWEFYTSVSFWKMGMLLNLVSSENMEAVKRRATILHRGPRNGKVGQVKEAECITVQNTALGSSNDQWKNRYLGFKGVVSHHFHVNCLMIILTWKQKVCCA